MRNGGGGRGGGWLGLVAQESLFLFMSTKAVACLSARLLHTPDNWRIERLNQSFSQFSKRREVVSAGYFVRLYLCLCLKYENW